VRFPFFELPGVHPRLPRPALPVELDGIEGAPQLGLIDTGAVTNRVAAWIADAAGIDLTDTPSETLAVAGLTCTAKHSRLTLTVAGRHYDAPVTFCDPWPFAFHILGQEGFLRFFRVTICAAEFWLEVEPEPA
jgi:hypothetical protein